MGNSSSSNIDTVSTEAGDSINDQSVTTTHIDATSGVIKLEGTAENAAVNNSPPSEEEAIQLDDLERRIQDSGIFDRQAVSGVPSLRSRWKLLRFLRGWKHEVDQAFDAFEQMADYREENDLLSIRQELLGYEEIPFPYEMAQFEPLVALIGRGLLRRHGMDKHGNLLTSLLVGEWQVKLVAAEGQEMVDLLIQSQMYIDEYFDIVLHRLTEERGTLVRRHDLLNVANPSIGIFQFTPSAIGLIQKCTAGSKHYPEAVARITSCGNGMFAIGLWKLISPFVPKHTKSKIQVLGTSYYSALLEEISENEIPEEFWQFKV